MSARTVVSSIKKADQKKSKKDKKDKDKDRETSGSRTPGAVQNSKDFTSKVDKSRRDGVILRPVESSEVIGV